MVTSDSGASESIQLSMTRTAQYSGECAGGPWDGRSTEVLYPNGFLLVDDPGQQSWTYDYDGTRFTLRTDGTAPQGTVETILAAGYDVVYLHQDLA